MARWEKCYPKTLLFEGGFQANPKDKGNWTGGEIGSGELKGTKYGISAASYPDLDIKSITQEHALNIYHRDYWNRLKLTCIFSERVAWKVFDIAVNCGVYRAARMLQNSVGVSTDGVVGEITLRAVNLSEPMDILNRLVLLQTLHYTRINDEHREQYGVDSPFYQGWLKRAKDVAPELEDCNV